jgi:hypothetical protein
MGLDKPHQSSVQLLATLAVCGKTFLRFPNGLADSGLFAFCTLLVHTQVSKSGEEREFFSKLLVVPNLISETITAGDLQRPKSEGRRDGGLPLPLHCADALQESGEAVRNFNPNLGQATFVFLKQSQKPIRLVIEKAATYFIITSVHGYGFCQ